MEFEGFLSGYGVSEKLRRWPVLSCGVMISIDGLSAMPVLEMARVATREPWNHPQKSKRIPDSGKGYTYRLITSISK